MSNTEQGCQEERLERAKRKLEKNINHFIDGMGGSEGRTSAVSAYLTLKALEEHHEVLAEQRGLLRQIGDETAKTGKTTRTLSWVSIGVSVLALVVALATVITGAAWQRSQLPLLREIADNTAALKAKAPAVPGQNVPPVAPKQGQGSP